MQASLAAEQDNGQSPLKLAVLDHKRRYLEMEQGWLADVIRSIQGQDERRPTPRTGERRGLMILSGDLRHYHLPDLLRLIVSGRHSGTLTVTDGVQVRTLSFAARGSRSAPQPADRTSSPRPSRRPNRCWKGCAICFAGRKAASPSTRRWSSEAWCVPLHLSAEDLILCGCRWVDNWTIIQRLVPSADTIFELGPPPAARRSTGAQ